MVWGLALAIVLLLIGLPFAYLRGRKNASKGEASQSRPLDQVSSFAVLTHEIRTPLSLISGAAELLRNEYAGTLSDQQADLVRTISDNASRSIGLAESFLTLEKVRAENFSPVFEQVDLRELIRTSARELRAINDNPVLLTDTPEPLWLQADQALLRAVIWNLLNNALRHASGTNPIEVSSHAHANMAYIEVTGFGNGIDGAGRKNLFVPFAGPMKSHGTYGLGLAIVAQIAKVHHGRVRVDSTPGGGTLFQVELPRRQK